MKYFWVVLRVATTKAISWHGTNFDQKQGQRKSDILEIKVTFQPINCVVTWKSIGSKYLFSAITKKDVLKSRNNISGIVVPKNEQSVCVSIVFSYQGWPAGPRLIIITSFIYKQVCHCLRGIFFKIREFINKYVYSPKYFVCLDSIKYWKLKTVPFSLSLIKERG